MSSTSTVTEGSKPNTPISTQTFKVYLIHSRRSLTSIEGFLNGYADSKNGDGIGYIRIVYDREGHETNRTIAILSDSVYDRLLKDGCDRHRDGRDFAISPFTLKDFNFPGEGRTNSLFVPVPESLRGHSDEVVQAISDKLAHYADWDVLPDQSWTIKPVLVSREVGDIKNGCFISFKNDVTVESRAMIRVLLSDSYWPIRHTDNLEDSDDDKKEIFQCFWARAPKPKVEKTEQKKPKSQLVKEEALKAALKSAKAPKRK